MERASHCWLRFLRRFLAVLAVGWVLAAVVASAAPPLSSQDEASARKLYLGKCAKCHKLYNPAQYNDARWNVWMSKMSKKAKLSAEEERLLTAYIANTLRPAEPAQQVGAPSSK